MIIDAPSWYANFTREAARKHIVEVISSYGNTYIQAEESGGGLEGPVACITEGGFNSVQDYGVEYPPEKEDANVIQEAIETGNPLLIEEAMIHYHDRVVQAGGVFYCWVTRFEERSRQLLSLATVACLGNLVLYTQRQIGAKFDPEIQWIFRTKKKHPALHQLSLRRRKHTNADDKFYAFLRTAANGKERIIVVLNF